MRSWIVILIMLLGCGLFISDARADESTQKQTAADAGSAVQMTSKGQPDAFFPEPNFSFKEVLEGEVVLHSFVLKNRGQAPLEVKEVKTS